MLRDTCDAFIPELYFSERFVRQRGLSELGERLLVLKRQAPGILRKTVPGLGIFPNMEDDPEVDIAHHVVRQLEYLAADTRLREIQGVALYAPTYGSPKVLKSIDNAIRELFFR